MDKYNNLNEGPLEGEESAIAYKAATPGQENAENVPYDDDSDLVSDEIKQIMVAVASKIMGLGLQESVTRYAMKWENVKNWLELYEEDGINKLIEHCVHIDQSRIRGKPLRSIVKENINPDALVEDEEVITELSKKTLGRYINKSISDTGNSATIAGAQMRSAEQLGSDAHRKSAAKFQRRVEKRRKGVALATKKLVKEDEIDEATLGGEKYKGKENPNNSKSRNPGAKAFLTGRRKKLINRAEKAQNIAVADIDNVKANDLENTKKGKLKQKRAYQHLRAYERVNPRLDSKL